MKYIHVNLFFLIGFLLLTSSCSEERAISPKPRAYPKVVYPDKNYRTFEREFGCPMTFSYPVYAALEQDAQLMDDKPESQCWFDVVFPMFNGRIHCTYYPLRKKGDFEKLRDDVFELAYKHSRKASFIEEIPLKNQHGVTGFAFEIQGHAASPLQFFVSDSTDHFLRGALYAKTQINPDSLAPIYAFMKEDVWHMLETFRWQEAK